MASEWMAEWFEQFRLFFFNTHLLNCFISTYATEYFNVIFMHSKRQMKLARHADKSMRRYKYKADTILRLFHCTFPFGRFCAYPTQTLICCPGCLRISGATPRTAYNLVTKAEKYLHQYCDEKRFLFFISFFICIFVFKW